MSTNGYVKLTNAVLDEVEGGEIVVRGIVHPESLAHLKVADYQREILPMSTINQLKSAVEKGSVPDIDLGMRGSMYQEGDTGFLLKNEVFIIDGLQRVTAARHLLSAGKTYRLGAIVHFDTNEQWERDRFRVLNTSRAKLSPNVLIRNLRFTSPAVEMLFNLTHDNKFALHGRVTWEQSMRREHLLTALTLVRSSAFLHSRFGPGLKTTAHESVALAISRIMEKVTRTVLRENTRYYFDYIDQAWGIRTVTYRDGAAYLRANFLYTLSRVFADYEDFWEDSRFYIPAELRRKIATFPVKDPQVVNLAAAGGKSRNMLYRLMVDHINSGKRTKRLTSFRKENE